MADPGDHKAPVPITDLAKAEEGWEQHRNCPEDCDARRYFENWCLPVPRDQLDTFHGMNYRRRMK